MAGVLGHPPARVARRWALKPPATERPLLHVCIVKTAYEVSAGLLQNPVCYNFMRHRIIFRIEEMRRSI